MIAWPLHVLVLMGRDTPELQAGELFSEPELRVLADFARSRGVEGPVNLGRAMKLLLMMGGYLDRKHDPEPGQRTVWDGYAYLQMGTSVLRRACAAGQDSEVGQYWLERAKAGACGRDPQASPPRDGAASRPFRRSAGPLRVVRSRLQITQKDFVVQPYVHNAQGEGAGPPDAVPAPRVCA